MLLHTITYGVVDIASKCMDKKMEHTLAEKSYDYIRQRLSQGDLPPGKRLVNRRSLKKSESV